MFDGFLVLGSRGRRQGRHRHEQGRRQALGRRRLHARRSTARPSDRARPLLRELARVPEGGSPRPARRCRARSSSFLEQPRRRHVRRRRRRRVDRGGRARRRWRRPPGCSASPATCSTTCRATRGSPWRSRTSASCSTSTWTRSRASSAVAPRSSSSSRPPPGSISSKDVLDWMGDFGVFVRGTTVSTLDGALVVETSDEAASGRFLSALQRPCAERAAARTSSRGAGGSPSGPPRSPKPIQVFQQGGKVVFAYGDAAARDAVNPADKLGDSADFSAARDSLGDYDVVVLRAGEADPRPRGLDLRGERQGVAAGEAVPGAAERARGRHDRRRRRAEVRREARS